MARKARKRAKKLKDPFTPEERASFVVQPEDAANPTAPVYNLTPEKVAWLEQERKKKGQPEGQAMMA